MSYVWTNERPTKPGWYWWQHRASPLICYVYQAKDELFVEFPSDMLRPVRHQNGQWAGPIEEPKEA